VLRAEFSPDGRSLVTAAGDTSGRNGKGAARVWEVRTGRPLTSWLEHEGQPRPAKRQGPTDYVIPHAGVVLDARFSPDGRRGATAADSKTVRVWEADGGRMIGGSLAHPDGVRSVVFSPDGRNLLACSGEGKAHLWDVETGRERTPAVDHDPLAGPASFSPDGRRILVIQQGAARVVVPGAAGEPTTIKDSGKVGAAAFDPSGRRVAIVGDDETARVWSLSENSWLTPRLGHRGVRELAFSPDGRALLTWGRGVRAWDSDTGITLSPPLNRAAGPAVWSLAGPYFATYLDGAVTLWALPPRGIEPLGPPGRHSTAVSPAADRLATFAESGEDPTLVRLWGTVAGEAPIATGYARVPRAFGVLQRRWAVGCRRGGEL
jgi:WD40 repeat protein